MIKPLEFFAWPCWQKSLWLFYTHELREDKSELRSCAAHPKQIFTSTHLNSLIILVCLWLFFQTKNNIKKIKRKTKFPQAVQRELITILNQLIPFTPPLRVLPNRMAAPEDPNKAEDMKRIQFYLSPVCWRGRGEGGGRAGYCTTTSPFIHFVLATINMFPLTPKKAACHFKLFGESANRLSGRTENKGKN